MRKMEAKLLIAVLLLSVSVFSMNASADGDDIVIESDMTWSTICPSRECEGGKWRSLSLVDSALPLVTMCKYSWILLHL